MTSKPTGCDKPFHCTIKEEHNCSASPDICHLDCLPASQCKSCGKPDTYDPKRYPGGTFCENKGCPAYQDIPAGKCEVCQKEKCLPCYAGFPSCGETIGTSNPLCHSDHLGQTPLLDALVDKIEAERSGCSVLPNSPLAIVKRIEEGKCEHGLGKHDCQVDENGNPLCCCHLHFDPEPKVSGEGYTIESAVRDITKVGVCSAPKSAVKKILERLLAEAEAKHRAEIERMDRACCCEKDHKVEMQATLVRCREAIEKTMDKNGFCKECQTYGCKCIKMMYELALAAFDQAALKGEGE